MIQGSYREVPELDRDMKGIFIKSSIKDKGKRSLSSSFRLVLCFAAGWETFFGFEIFGFLWKCELLSKLLVSPLITPIVVPYIIPYISPL